VPPQRRAQCRPLPGSNAPAAAIAISKCSSRCRTSLRREVLKLSPRAPRRTRGVREN
jgi:hypothetical protein